MLVDTDVLIWHLRGYPQATRRLDQLGAFTLSAVSYLEVLQGMRNKAELAAVKKMLERRAATLLPMSEAITQRSIELMETLTREPRAADGRCPHCRHGPRSRATGADCQRQALLGRRGARDRSVRTLRLSPCANRSVGTVGVRILIDNGFAKVLDLRAAESPDEFRRCHSVNASRSLASRRLASFAPIKNGKVLARYLVGCRLIDIAQPTDVDRNRPLGHRKE